LPKPIVERRHGDSETTRGLFRGQEFFRGHGNAMNRLAAAAASASARTQPASAAHSVWNCPVASRSHGATPGKILKIHQMGMPRLAQLHLLGLASGLSVDRHDNKIPN
jgi:hypothetical protein